MRERADEPHALRGAGDVVPLVREFLRDDPPERFVVVYLDVRHRPIAVHDAHTGTCDGAPVHPTPSQQDRAATERLRSVGELVGIEVLDHIVLGDARNFSFAAEQVLPMPAVGGT